MSNTAIAENVPVSDLRDGLSGTASLHFDDVIDDASLRPDWRTPLPDRLPAGEALRVEINSRHARSLESGIPNYVDPTSGFSVFTAGFLASRGYCCASGCRHCPYET